MAELTPNLGLAKPTINGEETENTWGYDLNNNFDLLDEAVVQSRVSDGDKGDIVVSGQGEFWAFDPTVVTSAGRGVIAVDAQAGLLEQNGATAFRKRGITVHQQPPSGGVDGDLWLQYNLALPPEVNWDVSSAYFDTFAEAMASDIPNTVKTILVGGFAAPGDFGGGPYSRLNAVPPSPTSKAYGRSVDRNKLDGGQDPILGGYWVIVPEGGEFAIERFGGGMGTGSTPGVDNWGSTLDAVTFSISYAVRYRPGHYWFSDTLEFHTICQLIGAGPQRTYGHFPANKAYVIFGHNGSSGLRGSAASAGDSAYSVMDGFTLVGDANSTARNLAGVCCRVKATINNITVQNVPGNGFEIIGGGGYGGVADAGIMYNCSVHSCTGQGLFADGSDAQLWTITNFDAHGPGWIEGQPINGGIGGCGISDTSYYGNTYVTPHIAGFGNRGVHRAGQLYRLISSQAGIGSSTTPGTDDHVWYDVGQGSVSATFPEWSAANTHHMQIPAYASGPVVMVALYIETGVPAHVPNGLLLGGSPVATRYSNVMNGVAGGGGILSTSGFGGRQGWSPGSAGYLVNGDTSTVRIGATSGANPEKGQIIFGHDRKGESEISYRFLDNEMVYGARELGVSDIWQITTNSSTITAGRAAPIGRHRMILQDICLTQAGNTNLRTLGMRNGPPGISWAGEVGKGDVYFDMSQGAGGKAGYFVTTAGTVGSTAVVKPFAAIDA